MFESEDFGVTLPAPMLSLDDSFNSNPAIGTLAYRLPTMQELFGLKREDFDNFWSMKFIVSIQYTEEDGTVVKAACANAAKCTIKYSKSYTPMIYYMSPPIVYKGSETDVWFNPKNIMNLIKDLEEEELPFVNLKVGEANTDFEGRVDSLTTFSANSKNRVRATITDQIVSNT
jgi:hypothetical protein